MRRKERTARIRRVAAEDCAERLLTLKELYYPHASWRLLVLNTCLTQRALEKNIDKLRVWDDLNTLEYIAFNPNIDWRFILTHPQFPWNFQVLSHHKCITQDVVAAYPKLPWGSFFCNSNFPFDKLEEEGVALSYSYNPAITWQLVAQNLHLHWDWTAVSARIEVTSDILTAHPDIQWCGFSLSINKHVTWEIVSAHPDILWNWKKLTHHPNITKEIIQAHPNKPWEWGAFAGNPNVTLQHLLQSANKEEIFDAWHFWDYLVGNPNLTWDVLIANVALLQDYNTWDNFCCNKFTHQRSLILLEHARRHLAAYRLQKWWRHVASHPIHSLCRRVQWQNHVAIVFFCTEEKKINK